MSSDVARGKVNEFLLARGWVRDHRATKNVLITQDGQRRVTLGARCVVFETGQRGAWTKDRTMHPIEFHQLTLVTCAKSLDVMGDLCGVLL